MKQIIIRKNKKFIIDEEQLKPQAKKTDVCNALYSAIYQEFLGASENPKYKDLTLIDRFNKVNEFALMWLKKRGLE